MDKWSIYIELKNLKTALSLCKVCEKYKKSFDVNIECGRYVIDGRSIMGVTALLGVGRFVKLVPVTNDVSHIYNFYGDVEKIGAYIVENEKS